LLRPHWQIPSHFRQFPAPDARYEVIPLSMG
jgi:hypothetical protein